MQPHNLFSLLADRLLIHANAFTMATYNVLFEILVERVSGPMIERRSTEITAEWKIENPGKKNDEFRLDAKDVVLVVVSVQR